MGQLDLAKKILFNKDEEEFQNEMGLYEFVTNLILVNMCSTIGIKYNELGDVCVTQIIGESVKLTTFNNYSEEMYWDFCSSIFSINKEEQYNCSRSINLSGIQTRVYAMMPPLCKTADITISTTKTPPTSLDKQTISDEVWDDIVHSNFIIVGSSGSGKTYLANYLLNKYTRENERIAIIEEFGEIIPPNNLTSSIIVPPPKPGEESLLKFVTQQSNLMRLDAFYVGEVKGAEAWPMIVNMASGTRGGCTIHGESITQALNRLRALCQESCKNTEAIDEFIAKSIKYVVLMKRRNIKGIYKLTGTRNKNNFAMEEIYS